MAPDSEEKRDLEYVYGMMSRKRKSTLALLAAGALLLSALLAGCSGALDAEVCNPEGAPSGIRDAENALVLEQPGFSVIEGGDPFDDSEVPDEPETSSQEDLPDPQYDPSDTPGEAGDSDIHILSDSATVFVSVSDSNGYPVKDAKVEIGGVVGCTDKNGEFTAEIDRSITELIVSRTGYVPYYEELEITENEPFFDIVLGDANRIRVLIDSAVLNPYVTDEPELEAYLDELFSVLFTPGMDTYEKVLACYDYLIAHTSYQQPKHWKTMHDYWLCAHQTLLEGIGTCNCYSAAFTAMLRHIGLDCYIVTGYTTSIKGGYTSHDWTVVNLGGKYYIFDPQVEDAIADRTSSKEVRYLRFCLEPDHHKFIYGRSHSLESCVKSFKKFLDEHGTFRNAAD